MEDKIHEIITDLLRDDLSKQDAIDLILGLFKISPKIVLFQNWEEDHNEKTGWSTWGWEYESGHMFEEVGYELEEVLERDKYGNATRALFKYVG